MSIAILFSVIIPTYNRSPSLRRVLMSLAAQTLAPAKFEVLVVDDGSTDETAAIAHIAAPYRLRYGYHQNRGDAEARNIAAQQAEGRFLVFLDDDMTVEPDFLANLHQELQRDDSVIVMGTTRPCPNEQMSLFGKLYAHLTANYERPTDNGYIHFSECVSHLMAVRRDLYFDVGMMQKFSEEGPDIWCDVEFGYRAFLQGVRFVRSARAVGYHHDGTLRDLGTYCRRMERAARVAALLFRQRPGLERHLPMFEDKGPISWGSDSSRIIARKLLRTVVTHSPALRLLEWFVHVLEAYFPRFWVLGPLYRWIVGSYILRGYRQGIREWAV